MFWNRLPGVLDTVRARMCGTNVALILAAFLLSFSGIYFFQRNYLFRALEEKIRVFSNEFEYEYLTGDEERSGAVVISWPDVPLPAFALAAVRRQHPQATCVFASESLSERGEQIVTVIAEAGGKLFEFRITSSRLEERELVLGRPDRIANMQEEFTEESYGEGDKQMFFLLLSPGGEILAHSRQRPHEFRFLADHVHPRVRKTWLVRRRYGEHTAMALYKRLYDGNIMVIAGSLAEAERNLAYLASILGAAMIIMLLVSLLGSWLLAGMFLQGLNRVKKAAAHIAAGDFGHRVEMGREGREINDLAVVFNDMVDRTEKLLLELEMVSDDIAHDLRTPLTVLRGRAELVLTRGPDDLFPIQVLQGCEHLLNTINMMLAISQTEAGLSTAPREDLDMREVVLQTADIFQPTAEAQGIALTCVCVGPISLLHANRTEMQKVLGNLVDNAIKFTPSGGRVEIALAETGGCLALTVADTGTGILPEDKANIFKRFYRSDGSRSKSGNGLGLSLVKAIVTAYGGTIAVESTPGMGTVFRLGFPLFPATAAPRSQSAGPAKA